MKWIWLTIACTAQAALAGTADVRFVEPRKYTDAGFGEYEIGRTTEALGKHLEALARKLPDGQVLKVEVIDVDRAGRTVPTAREPDLRIATGAADWPKLHLRWSLTSGSSMLKSGDETLADMNYLWPAAGLPVRSEYGYEFRMLDRWFAEQFAPAR